MHCSSPRKMRGQMAMEFMLMLSVVLLVFAFSAFIYFQNISESQQLQDKLAATQACIQVASTISSFAALEGTSSYAFSLPELLNYRDYTVWISSNSQKVSVDYLDGGNREPGAACSMQTGGIMNSKGSPSFGLEKNATMLIDGGVITVNP